MKKFIFLITLTMCCIFASCSKNVGQDTTVQQEVTTTTVTSTTSTTTAKTTTKSTTTVDPKAVPDSVVMTAIEAVEVYNDIPISDFIIDSNVKLTEGSKTIDASETGEKKVTVKFEYEGNAYEKELSYLVVDTTPPVILNSGWEPYTRKDQPFDINSIVGYADNYDRHPMITYEGEVDTSTVGHYDITATVTDSSGNFTSWPLTVIVLNDIPRPQDDNERVAYSDFIDYYSYLDNVSFGIDVSAWQTDVDYNAVKDAGCEFVIMRMGYYYDHIVMDDYYRQNMQRAIDAGLKVGVYFYTADNTEDGVRERARWIVEQLGGRKLDFPVAFDWEEWGSFQEYGMNIHDLNQLFEAFCDELEKNGYSGMLYSSKNFLNNFWTNMNDRTVWLAHFVDETDYTGNYAIWQASAYGRIPGIAGDVDMDILFNYVPLD